MAYHTMELVVSKPHMPEGDARCYLDAALMTALSKSLS